jgi:hypothetical protein
MKNLKMMILVTVIAQATGQSKERGMNNNGYEYGRLKQER